MEFRQVQYFVCLYEEGSVTRAASRLNIVQPALSMQIAKLEEETGQQLFVRSKQGMAPTPAARQLYKLFAPVLADFSRAREQAVHIDGELTGHVRVGMITSVAQGILVDAVAEFTRAHPHVTLALTEGFSDALCDAVAAGQLDAAIINQPRRKLALRSETLVSEDILLLTGPQHPALPSRIPFRQAAALRLILPTRQHGLRGILESFAQTEGVDLSPALEVDSVNGILQLIECTSFATLMPRTAVHKRLSGGDLRGHVVVQPRLARQIACVSHTRRTPSPAAAAFMATLMQHARRDGAASATTSEDAPTRATP